MPVPTCTIDIRTGQNYTWNIYRSATRWPQCSCCGEPVPCRAQLQDDEIAAGMNRIESLVARQPGNCWHCEERITHRQKAVTYPGDNLDLPGGPEVQFHARESCAYYACKYESRWIAQDPRRERILTWPTCPGILVVHGDGSSECQTGRGPLGEDHEGQNGCQGHTTHDHGTRTACYVGDSWLASPQNMPGCPRGCTRDGHPGSSPARRPSRRTQTTLL
jgi:hypothetical protein